MRRITTNSILLILFFLLKNEILLFAQPSGSSISGKITDGANVPLPGATIFMVGTVYGVNSNESGDYYLNRIPEGKIKIQVSFVGYLSRIIDIDVQPGQNRLDVELESGIVNLEAISVTAQKRAQQVIDVPITMNVISSPFLEDNHIVEPDKLSEYVPGLQIRMQGNDRPGFVIRGLSSDEVSPAAQPRISVFYNNVPINRTSGAAVELFDMQQIDVLKGPQGTLFGRGATIGAVHYVSRKPSDLLEGYFAAGIGNFGQKEFNGTLNLPVISDKLLVRVAGVYRKNEGYIENTFGPNLNGKNTIAGRFSASFLPSEKNRMDLIINLQKDKYPGLGFMSMQYPNTKGSKDPFGYVASLEQGDSLKNDRDLFDATLTAKHFFNAGNFLSSITSFRDISADNRWDGDGTAANALDMGQKDYTRQFYQEFRYNYSLKSRLNGSFGISYWTEKASQDYMFSTNEQHMAHLFLNTGLLVTPDGQPYPLPGLPNDPRLGPLAGAPLGTAHQEENKSRATNQALETVWDASYQLTGKFFLTGGIRWSNEWFNLTNSANMAGGYPAVLGYLTGNFPNILFKAGEEKSMNSSSSTLTYRGGLKYRFNENTTLFAGYAKGHRPEVLQFTSTGEPQILDPETVNSIDLGFKAALLQRLWFDLGLFYHDYLNFQTTAWIADPTSGEFNYLVKDGGKASAFGTELNLKYSVLNGIMLFGNYAFIHSRFSDKDIDGTAQAYAGNRFRLTPDHSFTAGVHAKWDVTESLAIFAVPSYSYKTKIFFEDANTPGLEQDAYGILNFNGGVKLTKMNLTLSVWGDNLLDQKFIISAGNMGSLFGDPTQIPGSPKTFGTRISWSF